MTAAGKGRRFIVQSKGRFIVQSKGRFIVQSKVSNEPPRHRFVAFDSTIDQSWFVVEDRSRAHVFEIEAAAHDFAYDLNQGHGFEFFGLETDERCWQVASVPCA